MKTFDINRFKLTLMWVLGSQRKEMLNYFLVCFFIFMAIFGVNYINGTVYKNVDMGVSAFVSVIFVLMMICGSWICSNMKNKQQKIMFKMLPATDMEKFAARYLYVTFGYAIIAFVAFCAADLARMLLNIILGYGAGDSGIVELIKYISVSNLIHIDGDIDYSPFLMSTMVIVFMIWVHSSYLLGGVVFRRRQFVLTSLVHFVLSFVFALVISNVGENDDIKELKPFSANVFMGVTSAVFAVLTVADYCLSYILFKRMQVINNRMLNI